MIGLRALTAASLTRTNTPVEEIPQSITILPRQVLEDQQVPSVAVALRNASGVVPAPGLLTPAFDPTTIRGFSSEQLLDGFSQSYNPGDREGTINIERIEVLKGTSGLLFGGGSGAPTGGIINLISKQPEAKRFAETGLTGAPKARSARSLTSTNR